RRRLGAVATCYPLRALDQGVMSTQCPLVDTVPAGGSPTTRLLGTSSSEQGTHSTMSFIPVRNHGVCRPRCPSPIAATAEVHPPNAPATTPGMPIPIAAPDRWPRQACPHRCWCRDWPTDTRDPP